MFSHVWTRANTMNQTGCWINTHLVFLSWSLIFFSISASVRVSSRGHHWSASPVFLMAISTVGRGFSLHENNKHFISLHYPLPLWPIVHVVVSCGCDFPPCESDQTWNRFQWILAHANWAASLTDWNKTLKLLLQKKKKFSYLMT